MKVLTALITALSKNFIFNFYNFSLALQQVVGLTGAAAKIIYPIYKLSSAAASVLKPVLYAYFSKSILRVADCCPIFK